MSKQMLELADRLASMPAAEAIRNPQDWAVIMTALRQCSAVDVLPDGRGVPSIKDDALWARLASALTRPQADILPQIAFTIDEQTAAEIEQIEASLPASERLKHAIRIVSTEPQAARSAREAERFERTGLHVEEARTLDESESRFPLQYEDGPDYCTVKDAQGRDFALTVQPEMMKAMERAVLTLTRPER